MTIKHQGGDAKTLIRVHYDNCSIILLVLLITSINHDLNYLSILESSLHKGVIMNPNGIITSINKCFLFTHKSK